jgi:deoxyadenosine/deoxycytidine kinase
VWTAHVNVSINANQILDEFLNAKKEHLKSEIFIYLQAYAKQRRRRITRETRILEMAQFQQLQRYYNAFVNQMAQN